VLSVRLVLTSGEPHWRAAFERIARWQCEPQP